MNFYECLGVAAREEDAGEIKRAYYKLSKIHHPDKGGDHLIFIQINEAYETLIDPARRAEYNEALDENERQWH